MGLDARSGGSTFHPMEANGSGVSRAWRGVATALLGACGLSAASSAPLHAQLATHEAPVPQASPSPASPSVSASGASSAAPKLDLRLGDLRGFVPSEELYAPWTTELDEVVIRPRREPPDLPERRAVPQGLGGLWWAAQRPTQAWRLFVPDPNALDTIPLRSPDEPQPPPGSWRLRLDQSGKVW